MSKNRSSSDKEPWSKIDTYLLDKLLPDDTGVPKCVLYASSGEYQVGVTAGPRIFVVLGDPKGSGSRKISATVSICKQPAVLKGKLSKPLFAKVRLFILINKSLLLSLWHQEKSSKRFVNSIKAVPLLQPDQIKLSKTQQRLVEDHAQVFVHAAALLDLLSACLPMSKTSFFRETSRLLSLLHAAYLGMATINVPKTLKAYDFGLYAHGKHCNISRHFKTSEQGGLYYKIFDPTDATSIVPVTAKMDLMEIYGDLKDVAARGQIHPLLGLAFFKVNWRWHTARHVLGYLAFANSRVESAESRLEERQGS